MGGVARQARPLGCPRLLVVLIVLVNTVVGADPKWIQKITDGLELETDEHCFVIAGEWTVLIAIDEPQPPPGVWRFLRDLQLAITRNSLLNQYAPGWLGRLRGLRSKVDNPERWWRNDQFPARTQRNRRGLINAAGHVFKFLFGTATEDEVEDIKRVVREFERRQGRMLTMMGEFTTIVNHTYDEIQTNRDQLNLLAQTVRSLTGRLTSELSFLHQRLKMLRRRVDIEFVLQELEGIVHYYVRSHEAFLHRKENLEAGRLTENILPPEILLSILDNPEDGRAHVVSPLQWYYENTAIVPVWFDRRLIYRTRLPLVDSLEWHYVAVRRWPVPVGDWQASVLLPEVVLKDTKSGALDVSPDCYGHRPRVCRRGLISRPTAHSCVARLLVNEPAYDPDCTVMMERRVPVDVVRPKAPNVYVLITSGANLTYRCEGRREVRWAVVAGVYRVTIESPCSLYGNNWYLTATFERTINITLQLKRNDFTLNVSLTDLLVNFTSFQPLESDLKQLSDVDRRNFKIADIVEKPLPNRESAVDNRLWHLLWTLPVLAVGGGAVTIRRWLRRAPAASSKERVEIELKPVSQPETSIRPSTSLFDFGAGTPTGFSTG